MSWARFWYRQHFDLALKLNIIHRFKSGIGRHRMARKLRCHSVQRRCHYLLDGEGV